MSIKIYKFKDQTPGEFNNGAILENRPIVLTDDARGLQPYSNIFYWAHAWSDKGSTIGEHPHRAFEILSFVLKGSIEHYDSKNRKWIPLKAGDVQIIRSGNGITHSEKINAGSEMFQIWFDPDLSKTISAPASYNDYPADSFHVNKQNGFDVKTYTEGGANFALVAPGINIKEISFDAGEHSIAVSKDKIFSAYILEGKININGEAMGVNDFFTANSDADLEFTAGENGKIFIIESPEAVPYKTYAERYR
jgi:redox-sensitive bicupin YhaK (pirin superfamily)